MQDKYPTCPHPVFYHQCQWITINHGPPFELQQRKKYTLVAEPDQIPNEKEKFIYQNNENLDIEI
jgi:hypothetical protein